MDGAQFGRLREVLHQAIDDCEQQIQQWEKYNADYGALQERLQTLPDQVTHDILVPFGGLAFMPGKMIHTNEILVLLGDDWFAQRSAKQACEIVERRKKSVVENLLKLHEEKKLMMSRAGFTDNIRAETQSEDVFGSTEECDSNQELKQKVDGNKKFEGNNAENKGNAEREQENMDSKEGSEITEAELWARLDALEAAEDELDELARMSDLEKTDEEETLEGIFQSNPTERKHVGWKIQEKNGIGKEDSIEDPNKTITFSFTKVPQLVSVEDYLEEESKILKESSSSDFPQIESPMDIYKHFGQFKIAEKEEEQERRVHNKLESPTSKPTSILKPDKERGTTRIQGKKSVHHRPVQIPAPPTAFLGTVVERSKPSSSRVDDPTGLSKNGQPQRHSKFKAARKKMT